MNISKEMEKAFNSQIQKEIESSYLYLSMSTWFDSEDLPGFAHWMRKQAAEETEHAMKMVSFVTERSGRVILEAIPAPKSSWKTPMDVLTETLGHEQMVTKRIYDMVNLAAKEGDLASASYLDWFVKEQVEEEASANEIIAVLKKVGDSQVGLYTLDRHLNAR